jgi:hypothetical protein
LQQLPEQAALHRLKPWPGDRPATRPLAALRSRPLPPRDRAAAVALSALILVVEVARHHAPTETALLLALLAAIALAGRWLLRDLRVHQTNFPYPSGLRLTTGASDAERQPR